MRASIYDQMYKKPIYHYDVVSESVIMLCIKNDNPQVD